MNKLRPSQYSGARFGGLGGRLGGIQGLKLGKMASECWRGINAEADCLRGRGT